MHALFEKSRVVYSEDSPLLLDVLSNKVLGKTDRFPPADLLIFQPGLHTSNGLTPDGLLMGEPMAELFDRLIRQQLSQLPTVAMLVGSVNSTQQPEQ